jgi:hypothetical protein
MVEQRLENGWESTQYIHHDFLVKSFDYELDCRTT